MKRGYRRAIAPPASRTIKPMTAIASLFISSAIAIIATPARGHGLGERYDLPIPLPLYLFGAAAAVALSFVVTALVVRRATYGASHRLVVRTKPALRRLGVFIAIGTRALASILFILVLSAAFVGPQSPTHNIAPIAVWVLWWAGFAMLTALLGNIWPSLNPWDALFGSVEAVARRLGLATRLSMGLRLPPSIGLAPAVFLLAVFVMAELIWAGSEIPRQLGAALLGYSLLTWAGMALFGRTQWLAHGEMFSIYFGILGRFAPLTLRHAGDARALVLSPYGARLLERRPAPPWSQAFVLIMLASVTFDGFTETPLWADLAVALGAAVGGMPETATIAIGWLVFLGIFAALYATFAWAMALAVRAGDGTVDAPSAKELGRRFVVTLVPIAIAYHLAHYLSFVLIAGQYAIPLLSDPFGLGWDLFGTALYLVDFSVIDAQFIWYLAVCAIVAGHAIAVALAHLTALRIFGPGKAALRSQYPMLLLMLAYTICSLWILAQPIVRTK